jgi:ribosomal protein S18 acetylase RimI-like enzyme
MVDFRIVEYDPSLAEAVADMWNKSGDSWGGYNIELTAETVRQEEETSDHVNLYLAVVGSEVVGYCKIGKWTEAEGALYVDALSVRPDFHGKKIGKALMLKSVERTTELKWPRLDLHTWPGNTKAVPLYKKTGFFWEERDEEVYCVNFIPGVLQNELVGDFFLEADWYGDSTRDIKVEPDGREENDFTYFAYSWEKNGKHLVMEFARRGRGLRKIDRDEYTVTTTVEDLNLVFGRSYSVEYEFVNKTGRPMEIEIEGKKDGNIDFDLKYRGVVEKEITVRGEFFVGAIETEQSRWKTHPRVSADISVNGKTACFQVGVVSKFPAKIQLEREKGLLPVDAEAVSFLNVESNLTESADFTFTLQDAEGIEWLRPQVAIELAPKERASVEMPYILRSSCVYSRPVEASARLKSSGTIDFQREVGLHFPTHAGSYHGERAVGDTKRAYFLGYGAHCLSLYHVQDAFRNEVYLTNLITEQPPCRFFPPKLGKPYIDEFDKGKPLSVAFEERPGSITMRARYASGGFTGVEVLMCYRLFFSGIAQRWFEVKNTAANTQERELCLREAFRCNLENAVFPYCDRFIETRGELQTGIPYWDGAKLTENWIFGRGERGTVGLMWDRQAKIGLQEWVLTIEHEIGRLEAGATFSTKPVTAAMNLFPDWHSFRDFAAGRRLERATLIEGLDVRINNGNPFVGPSFPVLIKDYRQTNLEGELSVGSSKKQFQPMSQSFAKAEMKKEARFDVRLKGSESPDIVEIAPRLNVVHLKRNRAVFPKGSGTVESRIFKEEGFEVLEADNGVLSIRSAPKFAPSLFSCSYRGNQWLHTAFPKVGPLDWWNPWIGGLYTHPSGMEALPLLKERTGAELVEQRDVLGNLWAGIAVRLAFEKHEDYRGLEYLQHFLLLPGVPVLFSQVKIHQNTGTYFSDKGFGTTLFAFADRSMENATFSFTNRERQAAEVVSGKEELWLRPSTPVAIHGKGRGEALYVYVDRARTMLTTWTNKATTSVWLTDRITCRNGEVILSPPKFFLFSEEGLDADSLKDLNGVSLRLDG